ncbi:MAG TPA: bifunctional DNA primase/polymerase [Polyangiaceae bacterium]
MTTALSPNARAARWYAQHYGWRVFPLHGKCPAVPKREGGRGYLDATTDGEQIDEWWRRWLGANVGIAAGLSGLVVADIDPRADGDTNWLEISRNHEIPETPMVLTGGGGVHYYFGGEVPSCTLSDGVESKAPAATL